MRGFAPRRVEQVAELLGTRVRGVCVVEDRFFDAAVLALNAAFEECRRIEAAYSRFIEGNDLARLNASLGKWTEVSDELFTLLTFGQVLGERTGGAFDLTVGSILEGWGYDAAYSFKQKHGGHVGRIELDRGRVRLSAPCDLGGLGKGYALDRMNARLESFDNVLLDAGGDLIVRGTDEHGRAWRVAFEDPRDPTRAIGVREESRALALASSSANRRAWKDKHHLVDPFRAAPASAMLAVYTQAPSALVADAWATALFVCGFDKARALFGAIPVEALLIGPSGEAFRSSKFEGDLFRA